MYVYSLVYVWLCVDMPLAADINIAMRVACISPGAPFREQISRTTRDLSRCEHMHAKILLVYDATLYETLRVQN